jgi:hypothetical protein
MKAWAKGACEGIASGAPFSVRWTGSLTPPLGEDYWFCVYNQWHRGGHTQNQHWKPGAGFVRVWLNGVLIIDLAASAPEGGASQYGPVRLEAGHRYAIKAEYASPGAPAPEFSLSWCSSTREWERIPTAFLHSSVPSTRLPVVHLASVPAAAGVPAAAVALDEPCAQPLRVMCRVTGSHYVARPVEAVIPAGGRSAGVALPVGPGKAFLSLVPSVACAGDGVAAALALGDDGPVSEGLVARYAFDEVQGDIAHDSVGVRHAAFQRFLNPPAPRWQPQGGRLLGAVEFGENWIPAFPIPDPAVKGDFTLSLWFRTRQAEAPVLSSLPELWLAGGRPAGIFGGWPLTVAPDAPRLDDGQWHHVAFVWNETGGKRAMALFVDGAQVGSGMGPGSAGASAVQLGRCNSMKGFFVGAFDDLRIYSRALSRGETEALAR